MSSHKTLSKAFNKIGPFFRSPSVWVGEAVGIGAAIAIGAAGLPFVGIMLAGALAGKFTAVAGKAVAAKHDSKNHGRHRAPKV